MPTAHQVTRQIHCHPVIHLVRVVLSVENKCRTNELNDENVVIAVASAARVHLDSFCLQFSVYKFWAVDKFLAVIVNRSKSYGT